MNRLRHKLISRALAGCGWVNRQILSHAALRGARLIAGEEFERLIAWLSPVGSGHGLIRVGGDGDGGYLLPDDLRGLVACLSPGTDDRVSFETYFLEHGVPCWLADASLSVSPLDGNPMVTFSPYFIGAVTAGKFLSLGDWVKRSAIPSDGDLVMQIDIEGWEYQALLLCPDALLQRCRVLVVEFHDFHRSLDLYRFRDVISPLVAKLSRIFDPVHIHANNASQAFSYAGIACPSAFELTLHRRDRRLGPIRSVVRSLPHPLDRVNCPDRPDLMFGLGGWPEHRDWF